MQNGKLNVGQRGCVREILVADLGLFGKHAKAGAGHVAKHAVGNFPQLGIVRSCVALAHLNDVNAQARSTAFNQRKLALVQVVSKDLALVLHADGRSKGFGAGASAGVNDAVSRLCTQHLHADLRGKILHKGLSLLQLRGAGGDKIGRAECRGQYVRGLHAVSQLAKLAGHSLGRGFECVDAQRHGRRVAKGFHDRLCALAAEDVDQLTAKRNGKGIGNRQVSVGVGRFVGEGDVLPPTGIFTQNGVDKAACAAGRKRDRFAHGCVSGNAVQVAKLVKTHAQKIAHRAVQGLHGARGKRVRKVVKCNSALGHAVYENGHKRLVGRGKGTLFERGVKC